MKHFLKTWTECYNEVEAGNKPWELRKNDRNYQVGDILVLQDYDKKEKQYTGRQLELQVTFILESNPSFGLKEGYVIMSCVPVIDENQKILPTFVKCSVSGLISVNEVGSTIFGGAWEHLYEHEVAKLGIDPKQTNNLNKPA